MSEVDLDHWSKFNPQSRTIKSFNHWLIVPRPKQITLGACVFLLKRPVESLSHASSGELGELNSVAQWFEDRIRDAFAADRFNYVAAMMKDPFFHLHAIPRYSESRTFAELTWADPDWPAVATFRDVDTPEPVLDYLVDFLREST